MDSVRPFKGDTNYVLSSDLQSETSDLVARLPPMLKWIRKSTSKSSSAARPKSLTLAHPSSSEPRFFPPLEPDDPILPPDALVNLPPELLVLYYQIFPIAPSHPYSTVGLFHKCPTTPAFFITLVIRETLLYRYKTFSWQLFDQVSGGQVSRALREAATHVGDPVTIPCPSAIWNTRFALPYEDLLVFCLCLHNTWQGRCVAIVPASFPEHMTQTLLPEKLFRLFLPTTPLPIAPYRTWTMSPLIPADPPSGIRESQV
jgi:hypothetical protein